MGKIDPIVTIEFESEMVPQSLILCFGWILVVVIEIAILTTSAVRNSGSKKGPIKRASGRDPGWDPRGIQQQIVSIPGQSSAGWSLVSAVPLVGIPGIRDLEVQVSDSGLGLFLVLGIWRMRSLRGLTLSKLRRRRKLGKRRSRRFIVQKVESE